MPAYAIFIREGEVFNEDAMAAYQNRNREKAPPVAVKPLVVYGKMEVLEGDAPDGIVVLEFANMEDARKWYFSEEYQEAAKLRKLAANYRAILVEGFSPG